MNTRSHRNRTFHERMTIMGGSESLRILLVDDDEDLLDLLKYNFSKQGFKVKTVRNSQKAVSVAMEFRPDLIVLDVMMPGKNGIDVCKALRSEPCFEHLHIFFLTAHPEHLFRDAALNNGADDYIEKLSGIRALTNKVSAVLKNKFIIRKRVAGVSLVDVTLDNRQAAVFVGDRRIALSRTELDILFFLMQNPNRVISLRHLIDIMWGSRIYVLDSVVIGYVENLQQKLGSERIETIQNGKYRYRLATC